MREDQFVCFKSCAVKSKNNSVGCDLKIGINFYDLTHLDLILRESLSILTD